jgi:hypothetical protein
MARKIGRPTKLTPKTIKMLSTALKLGNHWYPACQYAGVDYSTFRKWMVTAEKLIESGAEMTPENKPYFDLFHTIKKAEGVAEFRLVGQWQRFMPTSWQAIATFLERRYPARWGRKDRNDSDALRDEGIRVVFQRVSATLSPASKMDSKE